MNHFSTFRQLVLLSFLIAVMSMTSTQAQISLFASGRNAQQNGQNPGIEKLRSYVQEPGFVHSPVTEKKLLPPSNDECTGAILITQNSSCISTNATVAEATGSQPACSGTANEDVWFKFVATSTSARVQVQGSAGFDAAMDVWGGNCGNLTFISCTDITFTGGLEVALLGNLVPGQTYYVRVWDYNATAPATSTFDICVTDVPHCIPSVAGATAEIESCGANINGGCDLATPFFQSLVPGETVTGDAWSNNFERDVDWFKFHISTATPVYFTIIPEFPFDFNIMAFNNCTSTQILKSTSGAACDTTVLSDTLSPGDYMVTIANQTYDGYPCGTTNFYILQMSTYYAQNDICANAIPVQCQSIYSGTTVGTATDVVPACNSVTANGPGVWYLLPGNNNIMTASLCTQASFDTKLQVYSGNCGSLNCVTANDNFCANKSEVEWFAVTGTDYYIYVSGASGATGTFKLDMSCTCPPPTSAVLTGNTANSATIAMTQAGTPSSWDVEYGPAGFTQSYTPDFSGLTNPGTVTGMPSNEDFDFYVRSVCGLNDYSDWIGPFFMHTRCPSPWVQSLGTFTAGTQSYVSAASPSSNCMVADDFVVPDGECWIIDGISLGYLAPSVDSLRISFYNDNAGIPGTLNCTKLHPSFTAVSRGTHLGTNAYEVAVNFSTPVNLCGGPGGTRYWLSSQLPVSGVTPAYWETQSSTITGLPAFFRNPAGGFSSCTSWTPIATCFGTAMDAAFRIHRIETTPPVIVCPHDTSINITSGTGTIYNYSINATDNCLADSVYRIQGLASGASFPIGITTNTHVAKDPSGNSDTCTFHVTVNLVIGIDQYESFRPAVYPNPANNLLHIELPAGYEGSRISLYSIAGTQLREYSQTLQEIKTDLDVSGLSSGMYFLKFETLNGLHFVKFIKE